MISNQQNVITQKDEDFSVERNKKIKLCLLTMALRTKPLFIDHEHKQALNEEKKKRVTSLLARFQHLIDYSPIDILSAFFTSFIRPPHDSFEP